MFYNPLASAYLCLYMFRDELRYRYLGDWTDRDGNSNIEEDVILTLTSAAFVDLLKEEKTLARIDHFLKTGKPLRN